MGSARPRRAGSVAIVAALLLCAVGAPIAQGGAPRPLTIHAGSGSGVVRGGAGNDTIYGDAGSHTLIGGAGNDRLVGGPHYAVLEGGPGNDTIDARHETPGTGQAFASWDSAGATAPADRPDVVSCGSGDDTVYADPDTVVAADCEHVDRT